MNNSWWQELIRFFLQGITLKKLIHMLIILVLLILITPDSVKELVNLQNPEILPPYWMYYALLFCISYVASDAIEFAYQKVKSRIKLNKERKEMEQESVDAANLLDSLSVHEKCFLAFAVEANNRLVSSAGDKATKSLIKKGLLVHDGAFLQDRSKSRFHIPPKYFRECYIRFAGKADTFMDEVIASDE